jgi:hypothetical protein
MSMYLYIWKSVSVIGAVREAKQRKFTENKYVYCQWNLSQLVQENTLNQVILAECDFFFLFLHLKNVKRITAWLRSPPPIRQIAS